MQRISVSSLEKFRRYMTEASTWDTEEALIESIKGEFLGNEKTRCGTAYHEVIEGNYVPVQYEDFTKYAVKVDNSKHPENQERPYEYHFTPDQVSAALEFRDDHPHMIHEVPAYKTYKTDRGDVQISLRVDGVDGNIVHDFKTKFSSWAVLDYTDSIQWKIYLDVFDVDQFKYQIFEVRKCSGQNAFVEKPGEPFFTTGEFLPAVEINCFRYDGMQAEIERTLNDFMQYIHMRDLYQYLKPSKAEELNF